MIVDLYSEQDAETKIIIPALASLGYIERPKSDVRIRHQHPIRVQQGREAKTIFADVVVFINDNPVIVVDAKNPRAYLTENDREQVISYARLIGNVAPYAVLCNGHSWQIFNSVTKQQISSLPSYSHLIADVQRLMLGDRQRDGLRQQAQRVLFAIESARELSRIMRRCHDVIRNLKGFDPTRAFDELSKLLFAKMYEEREIQSGRRQEKNNRFTISYVRAMRGDGVDIIDRLWQETVNAEQYRGVFSDEDSLGHINLPPAAIDEIVSILQDKSLGQTDLDVKGVAFEEFLAGTYRGGGLGQFFTPREVVRFMVDLVNPAIGEKAIDPSCGTGGFIIRIYDVISEKIRTSELSDKEKETRLRELASSRLVGIDWETRAARTCKMNMIIHGDGHAGVYQANSLDLEEVNRKIAERRKVFPDAPNIEDGTFDIILTNPPFGAYDRSGEVLKYYDLGVRGSQKREVLMLERCIRLLRPGGRMAVVIPEGILSNKNDRHIRDYIRRECVVRAIIRLPQDTFRMSEGAANTSILYVVKKNPNDPEHNSQGDIFFARAEHIGISPAGRPIDINDLVSIKEEYRSFESGAWNGIEIRGQGADDWAVTIHGAAEEQQLPWLEPEVNRTSLLYDRLSYVVKPTIIEDRFSYTYFHPRYYKIMTELRRVRAAIVPLESICQSGYPSRGRKPSEDSSDGIPVLKVRNVTGQGIVFNDLDYARDTETTRRECARAMVEKGDILITSTGEGTIGRVEIYRLDEPAIADGHISICRLRDEVSAGYVAEFLRSEYGQLQMLRHVSGSTGQTELLIEHIRNLAIPIPDSEVQASVVTRMESARDESQLLIAEAKMLRQRSVTVIALEQSEMIRILAEGLDISSNHFPEE